MYYDVSKYMILRGFKYYTRIYFNEWILYLSVEQNPVFLNINSGATIYHMSEQIVFIILYIVHIFEKHVEM